MNLQAIFGRYISVTSPVHAMDPRVKLVLGIFFIVIVFTAQSYAALAVVAVFTLGMYAFSHLSMRQAFGSVLPLLAIVILVALLNVFFVQGGQVYFQLWTICISEAGLQQACFLAIRLTLLLLGMSLLTLTTTTLDITDGFEQLLNPLKRIGVPIHELAMIMGIALRFLPQFAQELQTIHRAQISRGAALSTSPRGYLSLVTSLLVPLFASAFRHAETLSLAMDARCYHGGESRTRLKELHCTKVDALGTLYLVVALACVIGMNIALPHLMALI